MLLTIPKGLRDGYVEVDIFIFTMRKSGMKLLA